MSARVIYLHLPPDDLPPVLGVQRPFRAVLVLEAEVDPTESLTATVHLHAAAAARG